MKIQTIELNINNSKPGRTLTQWDLNEIENLLGEAPSYPYLVKMKEGGQPAGNHYHKIKKEFFVCIEGKVLVVFEDMESKEKKEITLDANENMPSPSAIGVVVPANIAHVVKNIGSSTAGLLVFATRKARESGDDFEYKVI